MQTSSNSMRTLKGIFQEPKMNHRRNFLRENKLNLRELEKNTTSKITQQKQDIEKKQQKHLHRYHKSQEQFVTRRSDSQRRYDDTDNRHYQPPRGTGTQVGDAVGGGGGGQRQNQHLAFRRSYSQQRESRENLQPTHAATTTTFDAYGSNNQGDFKNVRVPRSASVASIISKAESCDKEIQTEDIIDEDFLYEALKKCSSTEADFVNKHMREGMHTETNVSNANVSLHNQPSKYHDDNKSMHSRERIPYDYHDQDIPDERKSHDQMSQYTARSQYSQMHNGHNQMMTSGQRQNNYDEHLQEHFQNLQIDTHTQREREQEAHSSARSRQTMYSNASKKKSNVNYKLGNRDDLRLPRYLEKEKREKEEERQRVISQDPNCPLGHYALSEEERLATLNGAQKKMDSLVQELNRMPMTTETLRIRRRKVEIEKELSQIELDIRSFSKLKVYVVVEPPSMPY